MVTSQLVITVEENVVQHRREILQPFPPSSASTQHHRRCGTDKARCHMAQLRCLRSRLFPWLSDALCSESTSRNALGRLSDGYRTAARSSDHEPRAPRRPVCVPRTTHDHGGPGPTNDLSVAPAPLLAGGVHDAMHACAIPTPHLLTLLRHVLLRPTSHACLLLMAIAWSIPSLPEPPLGAKEITDWDKMLAHAEGPRPRTHPRAREMRMHMLAL